jgi:DNA-binding CsgD family transcriptional regulator
MGGCAVDQAVDHIVAGWIDLDERARIVVDANLTAHWMSSRARSLMDDNRSVVHRNGRLLPRDRRVEGQLRTFVERATSVVSAQCISDGDTGDQVVLTATRLPSPWEHLVGVTLQRADYEVTVRLADLEQAFGLTPTEARVAHHLFCGHTAEETAHHLRVSLDTVRTHIKRAYAKLGVSSREHFFHKLTPLVIALG